MLRLLIQSFFELLIKILDRLLPVRSRVPFKRVESQAIDFDLTTSLQRRADALSREHSSPGFHLLTDNLEAFKVRCEMIRSAEKTLDLQYYYFQGDITGHLLADLLVDAANRGVRVRLLLDDIDTLGADRAIETLNSHPDIEIRLFNPFAFRGLLRYFEFLFDLSRVGRRMHNKAIIADNAVAVIGGRNIGDIYFAADPDLLFLDIDLLSIGHVVPQVSSSFDEYWNSQWATPVENLYPAQDKSKARQRIRDYLSRQMQGVRNTSFYLSLDADDIRQDLFTLDYTWCNAELYYDSPSKVEPGNKHKSTPVIEHLRECLVSAQSELILISPYFVPGRETLSWFQILISRGVRIRVLTNSLVATDVVAVHAGYVRYRKRLLEMGVELYELKATAYATQRRKFKLLRPGSRTSLHAKTIVIDRHSVFVGSPNLDPRSRDLNTEMGLLLHDEGFVSQVMAMFADVIDGNESYRLQLAEEEALSSRVRWSSKVDGAQLIYTSDPHASIWRRSWLMFYRLIASDGLL